MVDRWSAVPSHSMYDQVARRTHRGRSMDVLTEANVSGNSMDRDQRVRHCDRDRYYMFSLSPHLEPPNAICAQIHSGLCFCL